MAKYPNTQRESDAEKKIRFRKHFVMVVEIFPRGDFIFVLFVVYLGASDVGECWRTSARLSTAEYRDIQQKSETGEKTIGRNPLGDRRTGRPTAAPFPVAPPFSGFGKKKQCFA